MIISKLQGRHPSDRFVHHRHHQPTSEEIVWSRSLARRLGPPRRRWRRPKTRARKKRCEKCPRARPCTRCAHPTHALEPWNRDPGGLWFQSRCKLMISGIFLPIWLARLAAQERRREYVSVLGMWLHVVARFAHNDFTLFDSKREYPT